MNQPALPAHLRALVDLPSLAEHAAEGIGSSLPPHISIQGNQFALIDASGAANEIETTHLDVCIIDRSDVICKSFYPDKWTPEASDPPACFSMNGVAPSVEASSPQARTCSECPNNVRGSSTSAMSGKPTKACRDEIKLAVIVPGYDMLFQFTLTPGSFTNWRSYVQKFKGQQYDIKHIVTRLTFERGKSGVLEFNVRPYVQGGPAPWIDEPTANIQLKALTPGSAGKATDVYVGRTDRPRSSELPPPTATVPALTAGVIHQPQPVQGTGQAPLLTQPHLTGQSVMQQPHGVLQGTEQTPVMQQGQFGQAAEAQQPAPTSRRPRRSKAEMEAAKAGQQAPTAAHPQSMHNPAQQGFQPAPFRPAEPQAPFAQPIPPAQAASFGIGQPAPAPSDWTAALDAMFPKQG